MSPLTKKPTNNVIKTRALLQTTEGKDEHSFYVEIVTRHHIRQLRTERYII